MTPQPEGYQPPRPSRSLGLSRLRTLEAFSNPNYRFFWLSGAFSYVNRWMEITVIAWLVLELTDSPFQVGLIGIYRWVPMLILGPLTGAISDRLNRKMLLIGGLLTNCLVAAVLAVLMLRGLVQVWHIAIGMTAVGLMGSFDFSSRRPLMMDIVGTKRLANGIALDASAMTGSKIFGPFIAGMLIGTAGAGWAYVLIASLYLVGFLLLMLVRVEAQRPAVERGPILKNALQGIGHAVSNPTISRVLAITVIMNLLLFPYVQFVPVFARDVFEVGPSLMGLLMSADGAGSFMGAIVIASLILAAKSYGRLFIIGSVGAMTLLLLFSLSNNYALSYLMLLLMGLGISGFGTMQSLIILRSSTPEMRGRMMGILGLAIGVMPFGLLLIGFLADTLGAPMALTISSSVGLLSLAAIIGMSSVLWKPSAQALETKGREGT